MPLVKIEIIKGHTPDYKTALLQAVHEALENALEIPDWDRFQRLYEVDDAYFERGGTPSDKFTMIELTLFPGRSREVKRGAIQEIARLLGKRLDIAPEEIYVIINEPPLDNWGLQGEQASRLGLRYKTD